MFDLAAQDSLGWYWPSRHDYYLYNSPPRIEGTACETYCDPLKRNPNFMKPMSSFSIPDSPLPGQGLHPHVYYEPDEWEGTPELDLYADELIPNLSCVNQVARKRHTLPNGGSTEGGGSPRHVLISPNVAISCGHYGVFGKSCCSPEPCCEGCIGKTGGICGMLDYRMTDPETGAVFMQRGVIREHYGMGRYAEDSRGWESLGFGDQATLTFIEWTDVYGPVNYSELYPGTECADGLCYVSYNKLRDDPIGEGGECTLTIGTCTYCPGSCIGQPPTNLVTVLDIPESECNADQGGDYTNGVAFEWTANVLGGETPTSCEAQQYFDYFTSYGNPNYLLCDGQPCEFKLHDINVTRDFSSGTSEPLIIDFTIQDEFKFPLFLPQLNFGYDPLADVLKTYPVFLVDQDLRVPVMAASIPANNSGSFTSQQVSVAFAYESQDPLVLTDVADNLLDLGMGATFDFVPERFTGDSSSPYFIQPSDTNNRPIYMGFYSGGDKFANQLHYTYEFLSGYTRTLLADGSEKSYHDDVYGVDGIYDRILTREYFAVPDCDWDRYPPCGYDLIVNEEYADSFIDVDEHIDLGISRLVSVNNIDENTTLIYTAPKPEVGGDSVIHKITHEDPSQPITTTNIFTQPHLTDVIDHTYSEVRMDGIKPATPQKIGNYVFVGSAAANVLEHGDYGTIVTSDSGKVVILNAETLSVPLDMPLIEVPKGITGEEINNEFFGGELSSNSNELFVSRSTHRAEHVTDVAPKVYVYEPIENENGVLTTVTLRQTITQDSHTQNDRFGYTIDATDDWLVIGAPGREFYYDHPDSAYKDPVPGKVYIYKKNLDTNQWDLNTTIDSTNQIHNETLDDDAWFGFSVSISDSYVAIGCPRDKELVDGVNEYSFGSVFIYSLNAAADSWNYNQKIDFADLVVGGVDIGSGVPGAVPAKLGYKVDLSNNALLISAPDMRSGQDGLNTEAGVAILFSIDDDTFIVKDLFDGLSFNSEGLGDFISLYEKTNVNDNNQTTKRVVALAKTKRFSEYDHETVYILKTTDETDVNENPGDEGDQDGDYEGYGGSPDDRVLSGRAIIQDSKIWQDYSYLLDVASPGSTGTTGGGPTVILVDEYQKPLLDFMHPLGLQFFGGARLDDVVGGVIPDEEFQSLETSVIGHYTCYTFNTIQNLRYNENLADLYPEGYNPQATGAGSNGNTFALPPENSPGGTTHTNRGFPYGRSGASFAQGDGYTSADILGYPYWMIFNHPNIWLEGVSGPSGSPEQSSYATAGAASFGNLVIEEVVRMNIDIVKIAANAPGALLQSPNIGNPAGQTGNTLLYGLLDGPTGGVQY